MEGEEGSGGVRREAVIRVAMGEREKRIADSLEKGGWHVKPAIVGDIVRDIEDEDEGAARVSERELEARVRRELLDSDLSYAGARFLDAVLKSSQRNLPTPCVLQVLFLCPW